MDLTDSKIEHKTLKLAKNEIHYFVSGNSEKDLIIFLHSAFSDHTAFNQQIDYFSKDYRVITIDFIGHGLSKAKKSKDKIDASSKHINKIIEIEGYEKVHIVGVSVGSLIAQYFAFENPDKIKSLTALGSYNIHKKNKEVEKFQSSTNFGLVLSAIFSLKSFRKKIAKMTCHSEKGQALFYQSAKHFERKSFMVMQGLQNVIKNRENIILNFPTYVITGEYDIDLAKKMAENWHSELENSKYLMIKGAGHCANIDQANEFNKVVKEFIDLF